MPPVFIHSLWRSCGTYLFNKFRHDTSWHAYFEPCSELLASISATATSMGIPDEFRANLRHTGGAGQSVRAFPLGDAGRVRGFHDRFAYDRFCLSREESDPHLQDYVSGLIEHAALQGRRPVAKFCRFGLRAQWLESLFSPVSIYVLRNPEAIFRSYWSFGGQRSYFFAASLMIVARNRHHPIFQEVAEEIEIPSLYDFSVPRAFAAARELSTAISPQDLRDLVLFLWALTLVHNLHCAAVVVDIDLLIESVRYRCATEERFRDLVGSSLSFQDVRSTDVAPSPARTVSSRGAAVTRRALKAIGPVSDDRVALSDASRSVLDAVL